MRSDVRDLLRPWLGEDIALLEPLSDQQLAELCAALAAARHGQAKALAAASEEALRQMPGPLRGGVGKLLGH